MWVTLRRETFNHGSTSNSPPPAGNTKPATDGRGGIKKKIITAHRAGQWKSFPLDFFFFFAGGWSLAVAETQSLARSAYSEALTPLSTLHVWAPGRREGVTGVTGVKWREPHCSHTPSLPLLHRCRATSVVRCLSNGPTLKWQCGTGWWERVRKSLYRRI